MASPLDSHVRHGVGADGRFSIDGRQVSSPWNRGVAELLDCVLAALTLGIGWLVWGMFVCRRGYTPARKLLRMQTVVIATGQPAGVVEMVLVRGVAVGVLGTLTAFFFLGLPALALASLVTVFVTARTQTVADMLSDCVVVDEV